MDAATISREPIGEPFAILAAQRRLKIVVAVEAEHVLDGRFPRLLSNAIQRRVPCVRGLNRSPRHARQTSALVVRRLLKPVRARVRARLVLDCESDRLTEPRKPA